MAIREALQSGNAGAQTQLAKEHDVQADNLITTPTYINNKTRALLSTKPSVHCSALAVLDTEKG